ncbi:MAG TPA: hypothetical protein VGO73_07565 [Pyrinomonadaceae bacterium]|jgi:hypothetical protein|nr:hypothetical protein [Pyrinomonadaceae bacterium]
MSTNVERVLDQISALSDEEQQQVRAALNSREGKPCMTADEFEQHLLEAGVISEVKPPITEEELARFRAYKPIEVKGKPVSETLIEDRR